LLRKRTKNIIRKAKSKKLGQCQKVIHFRKKRGLKFINRLFLKRKFVGFRALATVKRTKIRVLTPQQKSYKIEITQDQKDNLIKSSYRRINKKRKMQSPKPLIVGVSKDFTVGSTDYTQESVNRRYSDKFLSPNWKVSPRPNNNSVIVINTDEEGNGRSKFVSLSSCSFSKFGRTINNYDDNAIKVLNNYQKKSFEFVLQKNRINERGLLIFMSFIEQKEKLSILNSLNLIKMASLTERLAILEHKPKKVIKKKTPYAHNWTKISAKFVQKFEQKMNEKIKIGFLKLRINKLLMEKKMKENTNPLIPLSLAVTSVSKSKLKSVFSVLKRDFLFDRSEELKRSKYGGKLESTLIPLSLKTDRSHNTTSSQINLEKMVEGSKLNLGRKHSEEGVKLTNSSCFKGENSLVKGTIGR